MPFSDYKVALVTGASAGMGEAIVERLCREGITVHAVARRREQLATLAER
ncbi:SDR family NAD(P)-dependent oxidoreductase, partial [Xanthomonas citri pv. citri]|nr:SDR family NAD(P)-dependent oxidoreductase [Xanthomonas citri pv. citri]